MKSLLPAILLLLAAPPLAAQTPARFDPFGNGCSSSATPPRLACPLYPVIDREFAVLARNLPPRRVGLFMVGASKQRWGNIALPLDLTGAGAPGCELLVSIDHSFPASTGQGTAALQRILPANRSLIGVDFHVQFVAPDPGGNALGLAFSDAATFVIGDCLCLPEQSTTEAFTDDRMLDRELSGGLWGARRAIASKVGGSGKLGIFDHTLGRRDGDTWIFDTDNSVFPARVTETGQVEVVRDGVFEFSKMVVPAGITVRFEGSHAVQIRVRGRCEILGSVTASAPPASFFLAVPTPGSPNRNGQPGSLGGPGGGRGGAGGDSCPNTGASPAFDGRNGSDVRLSAGHGYAAQAVGTGGKGSPHFPRSGINNSYCMLNNVFSGVIAAGGGGAGFITPGTDGVATFSACNQPGQLGSAPNSAGIRFDIGALPPLGTGRNRSLNHYGVGGSGGGGGGSHPALSRGGSFGRWAPGSAGAGGGGLLSFRVGDTMIVGPAGRLSSRGGDGYLIDTVQRAGESGDQLFNVPAPGGGGSGGSVLLQIDGLSFLRGEIDCRGGAAGVLDNRPANQIQLELQAAGGEGAPGYIRLERTTATSPAELGTTFPAATGTNVGNLTDQDTVVVMQSKFYSSGLNYGPHFLRYEIEARVGGQRRLYSDVVLNDPDFAGAAIPGGPVSFRIQGARKDLTTGNELRRGPWRTNVAAGAANSMNTDVVNTWRYQLIIDRSANQTIEVNRVSVFYQR